MSPRLPLLAALLSLALLAPASAEAAIERTVSVTAEATLTVPNDTASLGFSVSKERRTRGAALRAVSSGLRGVIAAVQGVPGVGDGEVKTGRISVNKTLHQPEEAGELVSVAIAAGATGVSGPNYFVGDTETASASALAAAFAKAKVRATTLAAAAGATLGPALVIDEGEGTQFVPGSTDVKAAPVACGVGSQPVPEPVTTKRVRSRCAGAAPPPTKPGTSTVTATVHVIFALQ
jgi:uncharacterized protein YggE